MLDRMTLRVRFLLILAVLAIGFVAFALITAATVQRLRVGGPVFKRIDTATTLIADILPPPAYIIESHLVANKLARATPDKVDELVARFEKLRREYEDRHKVWLQSDLPSELKDELTNQSYEPASAYYRIAAQSFVPAVKAGDLHQVELALAKMDAEYEKHRKHVDDTVALAQKYSESQQAYAAESLQSGTVQLVGVFVVSLGVGLVLTALVMRSLSRQLGGEPEYALKITNSVASGNLSTAVITRPNDDSSILFAMRRMTDQLSGMVTSIKSDAENLAASADVLTSGAEKVLKATYEQSEAASSTAAAVQQVTVAINSVAQNSADVKTLSQASLQETERASSGLTELAQDMRGVESAVKEIQATVDDFVKRANEITAMTRQVKDIADQTNLLALNASIEAARAGEQGRGFAVVADEVRKLAEKSSQSANQIDAVTKAISDQTRQVDLAFEKGQKSLNSSLAHVTQVNDVLDRARGAVADAVRGVEDIAASVAEQSIASNEIARNVERISLMAETNQAIAESATDSARKLHELSGGLIATVRKFKIAA